MKRQCAGCEKEGKKLKQCSICKSVLYCNEAFQRAHWPIHKLNCSVPAGQRRTGCKRKLSAAESVCVKRPCTSSTNTVRTKVEESMSIKDLLDGEIQLKEYWPLCPCGYSLSPWTNGASGDPHSHLETCRIYRLLDPIVQQRLSEELGRLL